MKIDHEKYDALFDAILSLENREECRNFFEDLCSIKELCDLSGRYEVALLLSDNCSYTEVSKKTGASTATICRVNKSLNYGCDGYKKVIARMKEKQGKKA
ncbi:MAG: TrpR YerC/YecD [Clostridia bacterium]|nr:TrpR YerC/YecD [Clostridia bacterium]